MSDWASDPEAKKWIEDVREHLVPKIEDSGLVISLFPSDGKPDVKFAVELGFAIMLEKPIILAISPGQHVPDALVRASDEIVEMDDYLDENSKGRMAAAINRVMKENEL